MSPESHKIRTDADLERLFPEHQWWKPIPLRRIRPGLITWSWGCAFCLYRQGLAPDGGAMRFGSAAAVDRHLAQHR